MDKNAGAWFSTPCTAVLLWKKTPHSLAFLVHNQVLAAMNGAGSMTSREPCEHREWPRSFL
jgi:hypothetical protein